MAVFRRVRGRSCQGLLVVLLACLIGFAAPAASAMADATSSPGASVDAPDPGTPAAEPSTAEPSTAEPSTAEPSPAGPSPEPSPSEPASAEPTPSGSPSPEPSSADTWTPTPTGPPVGTSTAQPAPAFTLTLTGEGPEGALLWADDEISYELIGHNAGAGPLELVTITVDLTEVLQAATVGDDPVATITDADGYTHSEALTLRGVRLVWKGRVEAGGSVRIGYVVTVAAVPKATMLRNVARATWTSADGSTVAVQTAETANPVNPVAIDASHAGSQAGTPGTLADTGFAGATSLLALAGLLVLGGIALLAVPRRQ